MAKVAFSSDGKIEDRDADDLTNLMLLREKKTFSKARLRRMRIMSAISGNYVSRMKVFSEIQEQADYKTYEILVHGKTIQCAKVFNPALLGKNAAIWNSFAQIQRFELEDPEGILTAIPKHYAANMQHLESFSITWTRVKSLPDELFREGLRTLSLQRNHIKTLSGIERAVNLSNLDVSSNLLMELPKTFGQLQNLTTLNLSGNAIRELPSNFGCLSQLRLLDCSCNRLSSLPDSIENLLELTSLDVCNNHLTEFPENIGNMPKLEDLRARGNQLNRLPNSFGRLTRLDSLTLRKNKFEEVPLQLSNISSLQNLNMRENSIRSFPKAIPSLKSLILDSNQLEEIGVELLRCCNVQMLSIENNRIRSIPADIARLRALRVLHVSGNPIEEVPKNIDQLENLRHLGLRGTNIRELPMAIVNIDILAQLDIDECPNLVDSYLRKELKEKGIPGLKNYMLQIQPNPIPSPINTQIPLCLTGVDGLNSGPNQQQSSSIVMPKRGTMFAPSSSSVNQKATISKEEKSEGGIEKSHAREGLKSHMPQNQPINLIRSPGDTQLLPSNQQQSSSIVQPKRGTMFASSSGTVNQKMTTSKEEKSDLISLASIRESKTEDDLGPEDAHEYGTVNKVKGEGKVQRMLSTGDGEEQLNVMDSGVLIRQRLDAQNTELSGAKRQSHV